MLQHIDPRTLYLRVSSGLGNRLAPILFATRLLELDYFDRLIIRWGHMNCSQFQLTDLFEICSDKIQIITPDLELSVPWISCRSCPIRPALLISWRYYLNNTYYGYAPLISENDRHLSNEEIVHQVRCAYPNYLKIRPELLQIANEFPITNEYLGIHCRRTDVDLNEIRYIEPSNHEVLSKLARVRDHLFTEQLAKYIDNADKLFIASDDQITKEYYKSKFINTVTRESKLPIEMWKIHPNHEKFGHWGQTLRSRIDIIDAFIELLILSRCYTIITDYKSSYALTAYYLMGSTVYYLKSTEPILPRFRKLR